MGQRRGAGKGVRGVERHGGRDGEGEGTDGGRDGGTKRGGE